MAKYEKKQWYNAGHSSAIPLNANNIQYLDNGISLSLSKDIGFIAFYCASTPPDGWLVCNGQAVSRVDYEDLFDVIGVTFGAGDGATTFNLPDMQGMFVRGWNGESSGSDSGRTFGSTQGGTRFSYDNSGSRMDPNSAEPSGDMHIRGGSGSGTYDDVPMYKVRPDNIALLPCIYTGVFNTI